MRHAFLFLLFMSSVAYADPAGDRELGKKLWISGATDYDLGKYDTAIEKFEAAYKLYPRPDILYNLGQSHRQKKNYEEAIKQFKAYLHYKPQAPNRADVQSLIAELDGLISAQKKSSEHPPEGVQPPPQPPPAEPAPERAQAAPAPAPPPLQAHEQAAISAAPPQPAKVAEGRRWYQDPLAWSLTGVGIVAAGVGAGLIVHGSGQFSDAKTTLDQAEARDLRSSGKRSQTTGAVLVGVGGAVAIAGIVKMVVTGSSNRERSHVSMVVGPRWLALAGEF